MIRKTVLFVAYGGGHAQSLVPIIKPLRQMKIRCIVLGVSTGAITFRSAGLECLDFTDLIPKRFEDLVAAYGSKLLEENHNPSSGLTRDQSVAYLGLSYLNNVVREGQEQAATLYFAQGRQSFLPLDAMETLIENTQPDLVVTSVSPRTELAARMIASKKGITTIAVADSINPDLPSNPIIVDTLCVPSEIAKVRWTEKEYVISGNVVVTGNPAYDKLCDLPKAERTSILFCQQASKLNTNIKVWENLGETRIFEHFDQWEEIANRIDTPCEVRLHPTINTDVFFKWKANERKKLELDTEPNTGISLSTRKVIIGNLSTILTEALYTKTPVIQYLYEGEVDTLDAFIKMGMVKSVRLNDIDGITEIIQKTVKGEVSFTKEFRNFESKYPPPPSAPKVVDQILNWLAKI